MVYIPVAILVLFFLFISYVVYQSLTVREMNEEIAEKMDQLTDTKKLELFMEVKGLSINDIGAGTSWTPKRIGKEIGLSSNNVRQAIHKVRGEYEKDFESDH